MSDASNPTPTVKNTGTRTESDSFGPIEVPIDALWGAQTARSLQFFAIGDTRMPLAIIHAMAWIKWAAARVNADLLLLDPTRAAAIADAALAVAEGRHDRAFPLSVWQTGSGTQSHMNVNEVVAHLATAGLRRIATDGPAVDPHDDVNLGQSSNDVFPTAVHIAVTGAAKRDLLPALDQLRHSLTARSAKFADVVKLGRTHLQDAVPITFGQEFGGYIAQLDFCDATLRSALPGVHALAIGGTAVGTGLNTHSEFGSRVAALLSDRLDMPLVRATNPFAALAGKEALVAFHAAARVLAIALLKIGADIRLMGSGPRAGLGELRLPANEPGSSIMPGKVNPTQIEALTMVCVQVMGHDTAIGIAASLGQFELNTCQPVIALDVLDSVRLLADAMRSFARHCVDGITVDEARVAELLRGSLMLVTALTPHIGHDRAARIAGRASAHGTTLREAALASGEISEAQFDAWTDPRGMLGPTRPAEGMP